MPPEYLLSMSSWREYHVGLMLTSEKQDSSRSCPGIDRAGPEHASLLLPPLPYRHTLRFLPSLSQCLQPHLQAKSTQLLFFPSFYAKLLTQGNNGKKLIRAQTSNPVSAFCLLFPLPLSNTDVSTFFRNRERYTEVLL